MMRDEAIALARKHAKAKPQSYYAEPFEPHEWVVDAIIAAAKQPYAGNKCAANMNADPPRDCNAPFCGCDPRWFQCMEMMQECGFKSPDEVRQLEDALRFYASQAVYSMPITDISNHAFTDRGRRAREALK